MIENKELGFMLITQTGVCPLIISKNTVLVSQDCTERSMRNPKAQSAISRRRDVLRHVTSHDSCCP
jgi:hypothetical protein